MDIIEFYLIPFIDEHLEEKNKSLIRSLKERAKIRVSLCASFTKTFSISNLSNKEKPTFPTLTSVPRVFAIRPATILLK